MTEKTESTSRHDDNAPAERAYWIEKILNFLTEIGIEHSYEEATADFLPGIKIAEGRLLVSGAVFPGDILHEAGHLCTIPPEFRPRASGNLYAVFHEMSAYLEANGHGLYSYPEDPLCRAILQCSDPEATAWQYAAACHLGLPDQWLFPKESYGPNGPDDTLQRLKARAYLGINGLQAAGWTTAGNFVPPGKARYPKLHFWLHPGKALHATQAA